MIGTMRMIDGMVKLRMDIIPTVGGQAHSKL